MEVCITVFKIYLLTYLFIIVVIILLALHCE